MKTKTWLLLFIIVAATELATQLFELGSVHIVSKILLMPLLIGYWLSMPKEKNQDLRKWVVVALFFSWLGDTLLLFQGEKPIFFILGLVAFLLAHVAYIISFTRLKSTASAMGKPIIIVLFVVYSSILVFVLWPGLGGMKLPAILYGVILTTMGTIGVIKNTTSCPLLTFGVLFFVASDSILAINKFLFEVPYNGVLIMSTYILAQWLIVEGFSKRSRATP